MKLKILNVLVVQNCANYQIMGLINILKFACRPQVYGLNYQVFMIFVKKELILKIFVNIYCFT